MSDKKFKIYLPFKNRATAEKWLAERGIKAQFDKSRVVNVEVKYKCKTPKKSNSTI